MSPGKQNQTEMRLPTVAEQWTVHYGLIVSPKFMLNLLSNAILNGGVFRERLDVPNRTNTSQGQYGDSTVTPTLTADDKGSLPGEFWQARKAKSVSQKEKVQSFLPLLPPPAARKDSMNSLHQVISLRTDLRFFQFPEVEK